MVNPLVVDLSHWDPADDYDAVKSAGIAACIYKATEGTSYTDPTYVEQQAAAKAVGLLWGAYHFADSSSVTKQIDNFLRFAAPDPDELFCLDWEDNGGDTMSLDAAKTWISEVERQLGREAECVLYGGNTIKEALGDTIDVFLGARRLWLCQYGNSPTIQPSWESYWLWQYTDGEYGPDPHTIPGIGPCDINSYAGTAAELAAEWASGLPVPAPIPPLKTDTTVLVIAKPGVTVKIRQVTLGALHDVRRRRGGREAR